MTDAVEQLATWWSPEEWSRRPRPAQHIAAWADDNKSWPECMNNQGYFSTISMDEFSSIGVDIWRNRDDGHLMVEVFPAEDRSQTFFVHGNDVPAFMASKYVELLQADSVVRQADAMQQIAKAIIGFVRHGHGRDTINEFGSRSKEELEMERHRMRQEQRARQKSQDQAPQS